MRSVSLSKRVAVGALAEAAMLDGPPLRAQGPQRDTPTSRSRPSSRTSRGGICTAGRPWRPVHNHQRSAPSDHPERLSSPGLSDRRRTGLGLHLLLRHRRESRPRRRRIRRSDGEGADRRALQAEGPHGKPRVPVYALQLARSDGKLGPKIKTAAVDCAALAASRRGGPPPPDAGGPGGPGGPGVITRGGPGGPGGAGGPPPSGGGPGGARGSDSPFGPCGIRIGPGNIAANGQPMSQPASTLSIWVNRTVVDRTGLSGSFDLELSWTPDQLPQGRGDRPPGAPPLPPIDPNGPSIFTAVQEQLGLKLDSQRGPVEVLVIDGVEQPTED